MSKNDKILNAALEIGNYISDIDLTVRKADFVTDIMLNDAYGATDTYEKLFVFDNLTLMSEMVYDYVSKLIGIMADITKQQELLIKLLKGTDENAQKENAD